MFGVHAGDVLGVSGPLEGGPLQLLLHGVASLVDIGTGLVESDEGTQRKAGFEVPDDVVLAVLVERENGVALFDLHGAVRPGGEVSLVGREVDEVDSRVCETLLSAPGLASPELDTLSVHGCEVGSLGRPLHERLGPVGTVDNRVGLLVSLVPEDTDAVAAVHDKLVTAVVVTQPPAQMLLLLEGLEFRGSVILLNAAFATEALNIGELVDGHGVFLVQRGAVKGLDGGLGLCGRLVLDKGVALGHVGLVADGHEDQVFTGLTSADELAQDELNKLSLALLWHLGETVNDYE